MSKEYTYDIDKYTIGVDENGEINFLGNCYGENARCLDLLIKENKKIKKQLEEINKMIEKCGFVNIEQVMLSYCGLLSQQKEFIKWLEEKEKRFDMIGDPINSGACCGILQKYKEIIGVSDEKK